MRRDFEALEKRRVSAIGMFSEKLNNSEVGRRLRVCNQTVNRRRKQF